MNYSHLAIFSISARLTFSTSFLNLFQSSSYCIFSAIHSNQPFYLSRLFTLFDIFLHSFFVYTVSLFVYCAQTPRLDPLPGPVFGDSGDWCSCAQLFSFTI